MRRIAFALVSSAALFGLVASSGVRAEAVKASPGLTVFNDQRTQSANDDSPTVLRGSASRRGTVDGRYGKVREPVDYQLGAGAKLWLTEPESGRVIVCDERRTSRVGSRFIGCVEDRLPY
ncbi:MAG: hypothetical protein ACR2RA_22220 [Geminicoccaceae bacterium]